MRKKGEEERMRRLRNWQSRRSRTRGRREKRRSR
jgi:hypothetical protein